MQVSSVSTTILTIYYLEYIKSGGGRGGLGSDTSDGAQHMRLRQGMRSISKSLASDLQTGSLFLGAPVFSIIQQDSS
jgi:hypothetical protein